MKWPAAKAMARARAATGRWAWIVPSCTAHGGYTVRTGAGPLWRPTTEKVLMEVPPPARLATRGVANPRPYAPPRPPAWATLF